MLDDFDMDFPEEDDGFEEEEEAPQGRNRTFMLVAGGLGGLIIIALICVAIYVFLIRPRTAANQVAFQTQTALAEAAAFQAQTQTAAFSIPSDTPVPTATNTPVPSNTPVATDTQEAPPDDGTGGGPTPDPRTATVQALLTQAALAQTQAAQELLTQTATPTATGLPDTGFADDVGAPTLLAMAALLIVVIFVARRLRANTA
jgi:hypothetical protein